MNGSFYGAEISACYWTRKRRHARSPFRWKRKKSTDGTFLSGHLVINSGNLSGNLLVSIAEIVVVIFHQRRAQIDGFASLAKIVGETRENWAADVFLNAFEYVLIAFVPPVDDDAGAIRFNSEALQGEQTTFQSPQRRDIGLRYDKNHAGHAQDGTPFRRELRTHIEEHYITSTLRDVNNALQ